MDDVSNEPPIFGWVNGMVLGLDDVWIYTILYWFIVDIYIYIEKMTSDLAA